MRWGSAISCAARRCVIALRLLAEAAVGPADPADACCIPESEDGAADGHVGLARKVAAPFFSLAGHEDAERLGVRFAVSGGTATPVELNVVDGLVAAIHRPGDYEGDGWDTAGRAGQPLGFHDEHLGCLHLPLLFGGTLTRGQRFAEFISLEFQHLRLTGAGRALVVKLLALQLEPAGLDLEKLGLLPREFLLVFDLTLDGADLLRLLAECLTRIERRDNREHGEDRGCYGGELGREG